MINNPKILQNGGMTAVIKFKDVKKFLSCFFISKWFLTENVLFFVGISSIKEKSPIVNRSLERKRAWHYRPCTHHVSLWRHKFSTSSDLELLPKKLTEICRTDLPDGGKRSAIQLNWESLYIKTFSLIYREFFAWKHEIYRKPSSECSEEFWRSLHIHGVWGWNI